MTFGQARRRGNGALSGNDHVILQILELVPIRTWTRVALMREASMGDRAVRKSIERLRLAHFPVLSSSAGAGYRLAQTADQVKEFREHEIISRLRVIGSENRVMYEVERLMRDRERDQIAEQLALV